MPELNVSIPRLECLVRQEFLYNLESHHGEFVEATVFGVSSLMGRAVGFHALLENGAMIWRLPVHAFATKRDAPLRQLRELELWDSFSPLITVTEFEYLTESRCVVVLPFGKAPGTYVFTLDWHGNSESEDAGPGGHKCGHVIELDEGNFAIQPNNRLCWAEMSKVRPFVAGGGRPDYKTMCHTWKCEDGAFRTSDDDRMFYNVEPAHETERTP